MKEMWGVNANNEVYRYINGNWHQPNPGARLKQITVGPNGEIWGVNANDEVYRYIDGNWHQPNPGVRLKQITVGPNGEIWGVNANDLVFRYVNGDWYQPNPGASLKHISSGFTHNFLINLNNQNIALQKKISQLQEQNKVSQKEIRQLQEQNQQAQKKIKMALELLEKGTLKNLNLNGIPISNKFANLLTQALKKNQSLIALDIRNTGITPKGMRCLIEVIKVHPTLCFLEFSDNSLFPCSTDQKRELLHNALIAKRRLLFKVGPLNKKFPKLNIQTSLNEHIQCCNELTLKWKQLFPHCKEIRKELSSALAESINDFQLKTTSPNAFEFDIQMTQCVLTKIKNKPSPIVMNFAHHAQSVLQCHATQADVIARVASTQHSSGELDNLKHILNQVAHEVGGLTMPHNLQHINSVIATVGKIASNLQNVDKGKLLSDMEKFANVTFGQVFKLAGVNLNDVKAIGIQLKEIERNGINLESLGQGINVLGSILNFAGVSPQLVNRMVTIGKAAITIGTSISQIIGGAAVAGPIGAIAGAIGAIFGLFSGPNKEEQMLENLGKQMQQGFEGISKQIKESTEALAKLFCDGLNELAKGINENFKALHEKLDTYHRRTEHRFDVIEKMIQESHLQTMKKLEKVMNGIGKLEKQSKTHTQILRELKVGVTRLNDDIKQLFEAKEINNYSNFLTDTNAFLENSSRGKKFDSDKATKHFKQFVTYGVDHATSLTFHENPADNNPATICREVRTHGHERCINLLAKYRDARNVQLPNLKFWARVVHDCTHFTDTSIYLMAFSKESPRQIQEFIQSRLREIRQLKQQGKNVSQFLSKLRRDEKLFHQLCQTYRNATMHFLDKIKGQQHPVAQGALKKELIEIDVAYDMLVIYLSLAFNNDFADNGILLSYLNKMVWTVGEFSGLIKQQLFTEENKIAICENISNYVLYEINGLENLVNVKLTQMRTMQQTDYAILDTALQELQILEERLTHILSSPFESKPSHGTELKAMISELIRNEGFSFNIRRNPSEITIYFAWNSDSSSKEADDIKKILKQLTEHLKKDIGNLRLNDTIIEIDLKDLKMARLHISSKDKIAINHIYRLLQNVGQGFIKPKASTSKAAFFQVSDVGNNQKRDQSLPRSNEKEEHIICMLQ